MPPPPTAKMKSTSAIKPRQEMRGHSDGVSGVALLADGRRIITCSDDGSLRLWDLESGVQIGNNWRDDGKEGMLSIALSPNGKTVASGSMDGTIRLWDVETEKVVARWTGHADVVSSLCWSVDGERVVSGSDDGTIRVWDVESGDTVLGPINTGHGYVIYSPDTSKVNIATGGLHETALKIWDAKTGNLLSTIKHDHVVSSVAWTSDQKKLITGSYASIRIFDTATWQQIAILEGHTDTVLSLSLFQNDRLLASGGDKTARLWNLDTNLPIGLPIQHEAVVRGASISADGALLVTGCDDKNAYVWDLHTTLKDAGLEDLLSIPDVNTRTIVPSQH
jgi:WD40 repeat protein